MANTNIVKRKRIKLETCNTQGPQECSVLTKYSNDRILEISTFEKPGREFSRKSGGRFPRLFATTHRDQNTNVRSAVGLYTRCGRYEEKRRKL